MRIIIISLILSSFTFAHNLELSVSNIKSNKGQMAVAIYKNGHGFSKQPELAAYREFVEIKIFPLKLKLDAGNYGVAIFQDLNSDQKMNKKIFGIPKEPFGFSNNPTLFMGPPKYEKINFDLNDDNIQKIDIKLKYY